MPGSGVAGMYAVAAITGEAEIDRPKTIAKAEAKRRLPSILTGSSLGVVPDGRCAGWAGSGDRLGGDRRRGTEQAAGGVRLQRA